MRVLVVVTVSVLYYAEISWSAPIRLKELIAIEGVRDNQLVGYGLVVGLNGTGDRRQTIFSAQTLANLLTRMGVVVNPQAMQVKNVAAVMITATLPPFAQPGTRVDVTVSTVGDASNLQGGQLLLTSLKGVDGQTYVAAQGALLTAGFMAGRAGNSQTVNHPTVARVPSGGIVERASPSQLSANSIRLQLLRADFSTAARVARAINERFAVNGTPVAQAESSAIIALLPPPSYSTSIVEFLAELELLTVDADRRQRIVINERTGTIVLGKEVRLSPVSILHGTLAVEIQTTLDVSQPPPLSAGKTTVTPMIGVGSKEDKARQLSIKPGATVEDLVRGLQAIGSTPREVIAVLQSMKAAGAVDADLEVI
jgi:flagellar P-ring protein precursor FlgI